MVQSICHSPRLPSLTLPAEGREQARKTGSYFEPVRKSLPNCNSPPCPHGGLLFGSVPPLNGRRKSCQTSLLAA